MMRFSKSEKVRTRRDWAAVRKSGDRATSGSFLLSVLKGESRRLGIVVGSQIGNAAERNRIKRIFREYFRLNKSKFPNGDCVIVARAKTSKLTNEELRRELKKILEKVSK